MKLKGYARQRWLQRPWVKWKLHVVHYLIAIMDEGRRGEKRRGPSFIEKVFCTISINMIH
jgi:hypothetical protein